ncbi:zf-HC2 domain-containing protein [Enterococcus sp. HY326]|uniref:zf-HC2 domain-containing protein n=1 Tax=Enterococcus sp. HY326 TaxID=2971265 RepID=UPI00223FD9AD|nr:zf-HC2 domain-containing protein [Enterococcus sp. HY326]
MLPCDLIRNSFSAYQANRCSLETKKIIDEHLEKCEECREAYQAWVVSSQKKEEQNYRDLMNLSQKLKTDRRKKIMKWTAICLAIISVLVFIILMISGVQIRRG